MKCPVIVQSSLVCGTTAADADAVAGDFALSIINVDCGGVVIDCVHHGHTRNIYNIESCGW